MIPMPDPAEQRAAFPDYESDRKFWIFDVLKLKRLGRRKRPEPGVLDLATEDEG